MYHVFVYLHFHSLYKTLKIMISLVLQVSQVSERLEPPGEVLAPTPGVARTLALLTDVTTAATIADDARHDYKQVCHCR